MRYVFLLNMGGAHNLDECDLFLKNMFSDKYILGIKYAWLRNLIGYIIRKYRLPTMLFNYKSIGGSSPLSQIQRAICDKLNQRQKDFHFDFISRYVPPFATDVFAKYNFKDEDEILLFPLYPQRSHTTITSSVEDAKYALNKLKIKATVKEILHFYDDKDFNHKIVETISMANEPKHSDLIISLHSLPEKTAAKDPYMKDVHEHFEILKEALKDEFHDIHLGFQSRMGPVKWVGPNLEELCAKIWAKNKDANGQELSPKIRELPEANAFCHPLPEGSASYEADNAASILVYPLSFCIDCSETLFELNKEIRDEFKGRYNLVLCPNDSEWFLDFLLKKVRNVYKD